MSKYENKMVCFGFVMNELRRTNASEEAWTEFFSSLCMKAKANRHSNSELLSLMQMNGLLFHPTVFEGISLDDADAITEHLTQIRKYKNCQEYYKSIDASAPLCLICPGSSKYRNKFVKEEESILRYALQSEKQCREVVELVEARGGGKRIFQSYLKNECYRCGDQDYGCVIEYTSAVYRYMVSQLDAGTFSNIHDGLLTYFISGKKKNEKMENFLAASLEGLFQERLSENSPIVALSSIDAVGKSIETILQGNEKRKKNSRRNRPVLGQQSIEDLQITDDEKKNVSASSSAIQKKEDETKAAPRVEHESSSASFLMSLGAREVQGTVPDGKQNSVDVGPASTEKEISSLESSSKSDQKSVSEEPSLNRKSKDEVENTEEMSTEVPAASSIDESKEVENESSDTVPNKSNNSHKVSKQQSQNAHKKESKTSQQSSDEMKDNVKKTAKKTIDQYSVLYDRKNLRAGIIEINGGKTLLLLENVILSERNLPIEYIVCDKKEYWILYSEKIHCYFLLSLDYPDGVGVMAQYLHRKAVKKLCYRPFALVYSMLMRDIYPMNITSIETAFHVLNPSYSMMSPEEVIQCLTGEKNALKKPFFSYAMPCYKKAFNALNERSEAFDGGISQYREEQMDILYSGAYSLARVSENTNGLLFAYDGQWKKKFLTTSAITLKESYSMMEVRYFFPKASDIEMEQYMDEVLANYICHGNNAKHFLCIIGRQKRKLLLAMKTESSNYVYSRICEYFRDASETHSHGEAKLLIRTQS